MAVIAHILEIPEYSAIGEWNVIELDTLLKFKAPVPNGIHSVILRSLAEKFAVSAKEHYSASLGEGRSPELWKLVVVRVQKGKLRHRPKNCRPVSLIFDLCKRLQSIIRKQIREHPVNHCPNSWQEGLALRTSCLSQIG